jgi:hypothetical protein
VHKWPLSAQIFLNKRKRVKKKKDHGGERERCKHEKIKEERNKCNK